MNRSLFLLFLLATAIASDAAVRVQQQANGQYYTAVLVNGSTTSKFDIVFIGDGFRAADQAAFNTAVNNAVAALQARPGYSEEMCGFNVWRVNVVSTDQGVDHPADNIARNTELDCRYGNPAMGEAERCIVTDSPAKCLEAAAYAPAATPPSFWLTMGNGAVVRETLCVLPLRPVLPGSSLTSWPIS